MSRAAKTLSIEDPMQTMKACSNRCDEVPDEVCAAVFATLDEFPGETPESRETRASAVAWKMAREGWRFCSCFATRRTSLHQRIFDLVHTNLANRLAQRASLERVA